jgi:hypothetical protein
MSTKFWFLIFNVLKFTTQTQEFFAYHFPKKNDILNTTKILTKIFQWCHQHEIDDWSLGFDPFFYYLQLK